MFITTKQINTAQKMKFSIKDFFNKCEQIRRKLRIADLVTFTEEIPWETSFLVHCKASWCHEKR